jgi:hypothetical protein
MSRNIARAIIAASVLVTALAVVFGQSGAGTAQASARPVPPGLRLMPVASSGHPGSGLHLVRISASYYWIVNSDGQCLDADSNHWGQNGDNVQLWSCNSNGEQQWTVSGSYIKNSDGQCLDADSNHWGQNGDNVQLWSCNSNGEQSWTRGNPHITNADGQCLDADSNHWGQNGDNVQLWGCNGNGEQSWPTE